MSRIASISDLAEAPVGRHHEREQLEGRGVLEVGRGVHGDTAIEIEQAVVHRWHVSHPAPSGRIPVVASSDRGQRARLRRRNVELVEEEVLGDDLLRVMWVTPTRGSTSCGLPAASRADESCSVWAATTLSSASPWMSRSGPGELRGQREQRVGVVHVGSLVRVAEVALGVARVVEAPLGDRRPGDRGVEHVGTAHHGECGEVAAEAPAADRDAVEVELGVAFGSGVERCRPGRRGHPRRGRGAPLARGGPAPGVPRPSATTTAKPWSANHCDAQKALCERTTRCAWGPPYGIEQDRQHRAVVIVGEEHGRGRGGRRVGGEPDVGAYQGPFGTGVERAPVRGAATGHPARRWCRTRNTIVSPPTAAVWTPSPSVSASNPPSGVQRYTWDWDASSSGFPVTTTRSAEASTTLRTWTSAGDTTSFPISRRRAPSRSAHMTGVSGATSDPVPGTSSTHARRDRRTPSAS
jgi:hypothetical protein